MKKNFSGTLKAQDGTEVHVNFSLELLAGVHRVATGESQLSLTVPVVVETPVQFVPKREPVIDVEAAPVPILQVATPVGTENVTDSRLV